MRHDRRVRLAPAGMSGGGRPPARPAPKAGVVQFAARACACSTSAASDPAVGPLGSTTGAGAVKPAALGNWARRPISLAAGRVVSSRSSSGQISESGRNPKEHAGRFATIRSSVRHADASRRKSVTAIEYANSVSPVSSVTLLRSASAHLGTHSSRMNCHANRRPTLLSCRSSRSQ